MTTAYGRAPLSALHSILLAFPLVLFTSAVLSDIAYLKTAEMQWSNFSAWLIAGGLFVGAFVLLWAAIGFFTDQTQASRGSRLDYLLLLVAMWAIGFINALLHSRDAGYSVTPTALALSVIVAVLALSAAWIGYSGFDRQETR